MPKIYIKHLLVICLLGLLIHPAEVLGQKVKRAHRKVSVNYLAKPELMLKDATTVAVLNFSEESVPRGVNLTGPGSKFAEMITASLSNDKWGMNEAKKGLGNLFKTKSGKTFLQGSTTKIYTIVARQDLDKVIEGIEMSADPFTDPNTAAEIGQIVNAQAIITGAIYIDTADKSTKQPRYKKIDGERKKIDVPCNRRDVQVRISWKVIDQETAEILGAKTARQAEKSEVCSDTQSLAGLAGKDLDSAENMIDKAMTVLSGQVAGHIMPKYKSHEFRLRRFDKDVNYWEQGQEAIEMGRDLNVDQAFVKFMTMYEDHKYDRVLLENLAVLNDMVGNYDKALELYNTAYSLSDEPHFKEYIDRVEDQIAFMDELSEMGVEVSAYEFDTRHMDDLRVQLVKPCDVHSQAAASSEIVETLPPKLRLTVLNSESDWYQVQAPGKEEALGFLKQDCTTSI